jgi:hypothetical protein
MERGVQVPRAAIIEGRRRRPDGHELAWRSAELVPDGEFSPLPFLIEWQVPPAEFPGAAAAGHPSGARGVLSLLLSDPEPEQASSRLRQILQDDLDYRVEQGPAGLIEIVLDTRRGPLRLS